MRPQQGTMLVAGVMVLSLFGVIFLQFYHVGTVNHQVNRQRHALDAATYSGAVLQAQLLNYAAYMNRAYMAHQIALAHITTMASWADFATTEAQRVTMANPPASLIGMMFGVEHAQAYLASRAAVQSQYQSKNQSLIALLKDHDAFSAAHYRPVSQAIYAQLPQWREQVIRQVLQDNYPEYNFSRHPHWLDLKISDETWDQVIDWKSSAAYRPWLMQQLKHYSFLASRNLNKKNQWAVDPRCPHRRHELRRRGHTYLDEQGQWRAEDTQSFHALRSNRWIGCYHREYPMGWAYIQATQVPSDMASNEVEAPADFALEDFWRWVQKNTGWDIFTGQKNALASAWAAQRAVRWQSEGWLPLLSLKAKSSTLSFSTRMRLLLSTGQVLTSSSGAESYFEEPIVTKQAQQSTRARSLFATHWLARLQHKSWFKPLLEWDKEQP